MNLTETNSRLLLYFYIIIFLIPLSTFAQSSGISDGIKYFTNNDYKNAKIIFEKIVDNDDKNAEAIYYLGRIFLTQKDTENAEEYMEKAVDLDSENAVYRYWLALTYWERSNHVNMFSAMRLGKKGVKELKKAIELKPDYIRAITEYSSYLHGAPGFIGGDKNLALEHVEKLINIDSVKGYTQKGVLFKRDKQYDSALKEFSKAKAINPQNDTIYYHMALVNVKMKEYQTAFLNFEKSLSINPQNGNSLYQMGKTCVLAQNNIDRGIECLKLYLNDNSSEDDGSPGGAHWRLGMLYEIKNEINLATNEYEAAVRLDPDEKEYKKALENIKQK